MNAKQLKQDVDNSTMDRIFQRFKLNSFKGKRPEGENSRPQITGGMREEGKGGNKTKTRGMWKGPKESVEQCKG